MNPLMFRLGTSWLHAKQHPSHFLRLGYGDFLVTQRRAVGPITASQFWRHRLFSPASRQSNWSSNSDQDRAVTRCSEEWAEQSCLSDPLIALAYVY